MDFMDFVVKSNTKGMTFVRTSIPDHFESGEWHNGGTCKKTEPVSGDEVEMKVVNKILRDVEISQFERVVKEMGQETCNLKLLDFAGMLLTRPDGHPGPYREFRPFDKDKNAKVQNDCLHWCLPGPIDYLNDVILETLVNDIEVEKCDLFTGKWIKDPLGPIYTNGSCGIVVDGHQNCITNGRPDSGFLYWKWKPNDRSLPRFDPQRFLQLMRNKSWALIGDSISRNHVESLLCMLSTVEKPVEVYHDENYRSKRWLFPSHNLSISNIWSPFLVQADIFEDSNGVSSGAVQLHLDRLDNTWTDLFPSFDYAIISSGEWFLKTAIYHENANPIGCHGCLEKSNMTDVGFDYAYNTSLQHVMDFVVKSNTKGMTFFRTSIPDHFESGEWHNGGTCKKAEPVSGDEVEMKVVNKILRDVEISQFERVVKEMGQETCNLKLLDFAGMLLTRPDGHPGPYREFRPFDKDKNAKVQNDCLHWCLPGPIDYLNDVILETLVNG